MNRKALSPLVAVAIIVGVTLAVTIAIGYFVFILPEQAQTTAPAPTDYFSLSCQQLKDRINTEWNLLTRLEVNTPNNARVSDQTLIAMLQIYQIKGCQP